MSSRLVREPGQALLSRRCATGRARATRHMGYLPGNAEQAGRQKQAWATHKPIDVWDQKKKASARRAGQATPQGSTRSKVACPWQNDMSHIDHPPASVHCKCCLVAPFLSPWLVWSVRLVSFCSCSSGWEHMPHLWFSIVVSPAIILVSLLQLLVQQVTCKVDNHVKREGK